MHKMFENYRSVYMLNFQPSRTLINISDGISGARVASARLGVCGAGCGVAGRACAAVARTPSRTRAPRKARTAHRVQLIDAHGIAGVWAREGHW